MLLGIVIGSNNLAASLALGALGEAARRWRIVAVFGLFEFFVPLLGLWLGARASSLIADWAGWLGPGLLAILGLWTITAALRETVDEHRLAERVTSWTGLLLLAGSLSIDNLIVGFSLGLGGLDPLMLATTIAVFSMVFAWAGLRLGSAGRRHWTRPAGISAGLLLLAMAIAMVAGWLEVGPA